MMGTLQQGETATAPTVSVIVPVYNGERYVRAAIESALAQTWPPLEILVIDDGSADRSREILRDYRDRVVLREQTNHGVCHARNVCLAQARGRYIAFLDADDIWRPGKLERQVAFLEDHPEIGLVHSDLDIIDGEGRWEKRMVCSGLSAPFSTEFLDGHLIYPSATMIRADLLRAVGGFSEDLPGAGYEDIELWVRLSGRCRFACLSEPLVLYRIHAHNNTKISEMGLRNRGIFLEKVWAAYGETGHRRFLRREFAKFYSDFGKLLIRKGRVEEGRTYLRRAIATSATEGRHLKTFLRACLRLGRSYVARARPKTAEAVSA